MPAGLNVTDVETRMVANFTRPVIDDMKKHADLIKSTIRTDYAEEYQRLKKVRLALLILPFSAVTHM